MLTQLILLRDQDGVLEDVTFKRYLEKVIFDYLDPPCFSVSMPNETRKIRFVVHLCVNSQCDHSTEGLLLL